MWYHLTLSGIWHSESWLIRTMDVKMLSPLSVESKSENWQFYSLHSFSYKIVNFLSTKIISVSYDSLNNLIHFPWEIKHLEQYLLNNIWLFYASSIQNQGLKNSNSTLRCLSQPLCGMRRREVKTETAIITCCWNL